MNTIQQVWYWHTRRFTLENFQWMLAYLVPRRIALYVFIRVYSATTEAPDDRYIQICKAWERGDGR